MGEVAEVLDFKRVSKFTREPFDEIEPQAQPWLVKGVLPRSGVVFVVGATKAGKSFLAIDLSLRLAAGEQSVLGGRRAYGCGVVYVAAEDPSGCRARVAAWRRATSHPNWVPFELVGRSFDLLDQRDTDDLCATLKDAAADWKVRGVHLGVVFIDTLARCLPGVEENSSEGMSRALMALEALGRELGVLVVVVAHFGKAGSDKGIRGWSGLDAASDATLTVERGESDPELRTVTFAKVKNGIDGDRISFRLHSVGLGLFDEDGEEITSCVPAYEAAPSAGRRTKPRQLSPHEEVVLSAVRYVNDHGETLPVPETVQGAKKGQRAVKREDVRVRAYASGLSQDGKSSAVSMRFSRALEGLCAKDKIRMEGDLIWLL